MTFISELIVFKMISDEMDFFISLTFKSRNYTIDQSLITQQNFDAKFYVRMNIQIAIKFVLSGNGNKKKKVIL